MALSKVGVDPRLGVPLSAVTLTALAATGSYRRWERIVVVLCLLDIGNKSWNNWINWTIIVIFFVLSLILAAQVIAPELFPQG
jgi:Mn2+/Fe2+ NRAMP family transporter